ncbi:hypothetical protein SAMN05216420_11638 [Nitrosospira sp. Nl5]|uniref:hypothetical protein n=1 Tax=Nitrosospira sp. Nl5 TaxID=200120 RepID=UPI00087E2480|nr:hypothetical protein [Nitrosospira sp. Nl5]SCY74902.1 hypothetical protein SAMN05216420_11638 [Nitrosospira sp. Nl5]
MSAILERLTADGLTLSVSPEGNIDIIGDQAVIDNWLETIRENKPAILFELRDQRVLAMLKHEPEKKYAILCNDASTDPVLVTIGIRGKGTFDMQIPKVNYDGLALLQVIEQYSTESELKIVGEANPSTTAKERSLGLPDEQRKVA